MVDVRYYSDIISKVEFISEWVALAERMCLPIKMSSIEKGIA